MSHLRLTNTGTEVAFHRSESKSMCDRLVHYPRSVNIYMEISPHGGEIKDKGNLLVHYPHFTLILLYSDVVQGLQAGMFPHETATTVAHWVESRPQSF